LHVRSKCVCCISENFTLWKWHLQMSENATFQRRRTYVSPVFAGCLFSCPPPTSPAFFLLWVHTYGFSFSKSPASVRATAASNPIEWLFFQDSVRTLAMNHMALLREYNVHGGVIVWVFTTL